LSGKKLGKGLDALISVSDEKVSEKYDVNNSIADKDISDKVASDKLSLTTDVLIKAVEDGKKNEPRLLAVEHPTMMILAIVFITIGFSKHKKKTTDESKFKTILFWYSLALLFILVRIPWSQWLN